MECWSLCKSYKGCKWFSLTFDFWCFLFEKCINFDEDPIFGPTVTGQPECKFDKLSGE